MYNYYFLYDTTTGAIKEPHLTTAEDWTNIPSGYGVIGAYAQSTASTTVQDAYNNQSRYLVQGGQLVLQPYFTVTSTTTSTANQYTLTATLNHPPMIAPANCTFTIAGTSIDVSMTNGQATLTVELNEVIASQSVTATVSASGCVSGKVSFGGTKTLSSHAMAKLQTDGTVLVKNTSKSEITVYFNSINLSQPERDADLANVQDVHFDMLVKLLQWAQNPTYAPLSLTADEKNAITDIQNNYMPHARLHMSDMAPATGSTTVQNNRWPTIYNDKATSTSVADRYLSTVNDPDVTNP